MTEDTRSDLQAVIDNGLASDPDALMQKYLAAVKMLFALIESIHQESTVAHEKRIFKVYHSLIGKNAK